MSEQIVRKKRQRVSFSLWNNVCKALFDQFQLLFLLIPWFLISEILLDIIVWSLLHVTVIYLLKICGWGGFSTFPRWRSPLFLIRTSLTPPQISDAHLLKNTNLSPSSFYFSVFFISRSCFESDGFIAYPNEWDWRVKTMFIHTNQPLIT